MGLVPLQDEKEMPGFPLCCEKVPQEASSLQARRSYRNPAMQTNSLILDLYVASRTEK